MGCRRSVTPLRCGLDVPVHPGGGGGFEHPLGEHNHGLFARGIDLPGRSEATVPAVCARVADGLAEPPRVLLEEPGPEPAVRFLRCGQLIGCHGVDVDRAEEAFAGWASSAGEQHPRERREVIDGGEQPGGGVREGRGVAPAPVGRVMGGEPVGRGAVGGGQAAAGDDAAGKGELMSM